jgi:hypothetical protein
VVLTVVDDEVSPSLTPWSIQGDRGVEAVDHFLAL